MSFFVLWLLMVLPNIQGWLIIVSFITGLGAIIWSIGNLSDHGKLSRTPKWLIAICITGSLISTVIPSKKEMAMIAAGGVTYNVVTSEPAKELGSKGIQLLNKKIDDLLKDEPEVKQEVSGTKL
jgi:hypothetical protein